ncbi:MAG TPA: DNA glycosylase [Opitutales bacterium]|nr:DNA glycosylase [Opitutales bacterium]
MTSITRQAQPDAWTPWRILDDSRSFSEAGLSQTLDGGQMFRFNRDAQGIWTGVWADCVARLRMTGDGVLEASFPTALARGGIPALRHLLSLDLPYAAYQARLESSGDPVIACAVASCRGLRVVRQPLAESLLSFLCSPMKRIAQIKQELDALAENFGPELMPGIHGLPDWEALAEVDEAELRACKLGFRAGFIVRSARILAAEPEFLPNVAALPYCDARKQLCELHGVGGKIADCALLYSGSAGLEPFPVDTWISRAMARLYGLEDMEPEQVAEFGRRRFGDLAGLAQQYLFVQVRTGGADDGLSQQADGNRRG